jgi:hypothetical protein
MLRVDIGTDNNTLETYESNEEFISNLRSNLNPDGGGTIRGQFRAFMDSRHSE